MGLGFLDHMRVVPDHRISGHGDLSSGRGFAGHACRGGVRGGRLGGGSRRSPRGRSTGCATFCRIGTAFRRRRRFARCFGCWMRRRWREASPLGPSSVRRVEGEVVAVDGKTLRGSKTSCDGTGALRLVSAYATEAGARPTRG